MAKMSLKEQKRERVMRQHEDWQARKTGTRPRKNHTASVKVSTPAQPKKTIPKGPSIWDRYQSKEITLEEFYDLAAGMSR